ncbi:SGNH/GDSL hydrolase family protein [Actinoallomurus rhizosphaericola]|uniref:SGNH/GDSL hydrolase family protein n=1 Tax=Actinoallomurus rhizosphaericola TaxID=2952536 RepID=UPI002091A15F|nr:SGNH/GDSL hydrolase family protein [Actinoallomurus rhizosphaericola]MCO5994351.1 SGNH/GDSL hydrolase family protein [Actinoallomurus rhizosphaericola]
MTKTRTPLLGLTRTAGAVLALTGLLLPAAACSGDAPAATGTPRPAGATARPALSKVLFLGDSIAAGEALPLTAAFRAGGVGFQSIAADGGGNVVGPFSEHNWKKLPGQIASAAPTVVVYQITTYDWGGPQAQRAAYEKLLTTVTGSGARLVFVTAPPIRPDDFYRPHLADLARAPGAARAVAARASDRAAVLDAGAVWGRTYQRAEGGRTYRSTDGIHTCPQGAARFTGWLLAELAKLFPGFTPPEPRSWANTGWSGDARFHGC